MNQLTEYEDLKTLILGEALGVGIHRKVGVFKPDESLVIKCALEAPRFYKRLRNNYSKHKHWASIRTVFKIAWAQSKNP